MNREDVRRKYLEKKKYGFSDDESKSKYSLRNNFGNYFEYIKFSSTIKLLNSAQIKLKDKKILDIGCNRGFFLNNLAFITCKPSNLYGVDFSEEAIDLAKIINPGINFKKEDFYELKFKDESFDIITLIYSVNCMPEKERREILRKISNKLKRGGHLIIFDFYDSPLINLIRKIIALINGERFSKIRYVNKKFLKKNLPELKIIGMEKLIGFPAPKIYGKIPNFVFEIVNALSPKAYCNIILRK